MSVIGGGTSGEGGRLRFTTLPGPLSGGPARNVNRRAPAHHSMSQNVVLAPNRLLQAPVIATFAVLPGELCMVTQRAPCMSPCMSILTCKAHGSQEGKVVPLKAGNNVATCKMSCSHVRVLAGDTGIAVTILPNVDGICHQSRLAYVSAFTSRIT